MSRGWISRIHGSDGFVRALRRLNALRREVGPNSGFRDLEAVEDALLERPSTRLAVYGSLAPGEVNAHVLEPLEGRWEAGTVRGVLHDRGWSKGRGFPGFVWTPDGHPVPVQVLHSEELPRHWERIDAFEGAGYHRALVPVKGLEAGVRICNVYVVAGGDG